VGFVVDKWGWDRLYFSFILPESFNQCCIFIFTVKLLQKDKTEKTGNLKKAIFFGN
jgi:hypothetical protein